MDIAQDVQEARFFAIIADESSTANNNSYLTIGLRYSLKYIKQYMITIKAPVCQ